MELCGQFHAPNAFAQCQEMHRRLVGPESKSRCFGEVKDIYTDNQTTMTAASLPDTKRNLYQTARLHVPLVGKLYSHRHENLKSKNNKYFSVALGPSTYMVLNRHFLHH